jgi:hypothetical protein
MCSCTFTIVYHAMQRLPDDLHYEVASFLDARELSLYARVSKRTRARVSTTRAWAWRLRQHMPGWFGSSSATHTTDWRRHVPCDIATHSDHDADIWQAVLATPQHRVYALLVAIARDLRRAHQWRRRHADVHTVLVFLFMWACAINELNAASVYVATAVWVWMLLGTEFEWQEVSLGALLWMWHARGLITSILACAFRLWIHTFRHARYLAEVDAELRARIDLTVYLCFALACFQLFTRLDTADLQYTASVYAFVARDWEALTWCDRVVYRLAPVGFWVASHIWYWSVLLAVPNPISTTPRDTRCCAHWELPGDVAEAKRVTRWWWWRPERYRRARCMCASLVLGALLIAAFGWPTTSSSSSTIDRVEYVREASSYRSIYRDESWRSLNLWIRPMNDPSEAAATTTDDTVGTVMLVCRRYTFFDVPSVTWVMSHCRGDVPYAIFDGTLAMHVELVDAADARDIEYHVWVTLAELGNGTVPRDRPTTFTRAPNGRSYRRDTLHVRTRVRVAVQIL